MGTERPLAFEVDPPRLAGLVQVLLWHDDGRASGVEVSAVEDPHPDRGTCRSSTVCAKTVHPEDWLHRRANGSLHPGPKVHVLHDGKKQGAAADHTADTLTVSNAIVTTSSDTGRMSEPNVDPPTQPADLSLRNVQTLREPADDLGGSNGHGLDYRRWIDSDERMPIQPD
ncbi:hypothetical protein ASF98_23450 [Arthrobacter sp. Leaf337]|nr:hypothetical protein ASF98_23450 [Arthrobacter sp. Leaf337]